MLTGALEAVLGGRDLDRAEAQAALASMISGRCAPEQVAALLAGLRVKGETGEELAGFALALRERSRAVRIEGDGLLDLCGTGGDGAHTFNISTTAAFLAAAGGARVAQHCHRATRSACGSADVLEALGIPLGLDEAGLAACVAEAGITLLFAPHHGPAMRHLLPVRKALGVRTALQLLGPLSNPAGARRQLVGVWDPGYVEIVAWALHGLGAERALVVCGDDGQGGVLDEVSPCGETVVAELRGAEIFVRVWTPSALGVALAAPGSLRGGDARENAAALEAILSGEPGPRGDAVAVNAGAALYLAGRAASVQAGVASARSLLASGAGATVLATLRSVATREASRMGEQTPSAGSSGSAGLITP